MIGEHISIRPRGREFIAVCPFHDDKNPSLNISPAKQIYKCFACGAGGDVFSFIMDYHKMSFPEALAHLAERAGIPMPSFRPGDSDNPAADGKTPRQVLLDANDAAVRYFRNSLNDPQKGAEARTYLAQRNISPKMAELFAIGYAPDGWDNLVQTIATRRWPHEDFLAAGIIGTSEKSGKLYDRFRHRLIFPIFDMIGRPIAFGGRKMRPEDEPKYLNSPETPLFNKSATLFAQHLAQAAIRQTRTAIIVEGYTDVIACHQAGLTNVVATLGTALTRQHAQVLRRFCDQILLVFDADEAGFKAADRALEVFFNEPLDVSVVVLPDGLDPADLMAKDDALDVWKRAVRDAVDIMTFKFNRIRRQFDAATTTAARQRINEDFLQTLAQLGFQKLDAARRTPIIERLASLLGATPTLVRQMIDSIAAPRTRQTSGSPKEQKDSARRQAERIILGCLLNQPALFHAATDDGRPFSETIVPSDFSQPDLAALFQPLYDWLCDHDAQVLDATALRTVLSEEQSLRDALGLQYEVDRMAASEDERIAGLLKANVAALRRMLADEDYQRSKQSDPAAPSPDQEDPLIAQAQRLSRAIAHVSSGSNAGRTPRQINP